MPLFFIPNSDRLAVSEVRYYPHFTAKKMGNKRGFNGLSPLTLSQIFK